MEQWDSFSEFIFKDKEKTCKTWSELDVWQLILQAALYDSLCVSVSELPCFVLMFLYIIQLNLYPSIKNYSKNTSLLFDLYGKSHGVTEIYEGEFIRT